MCLRRLDRQLDPARVLARVGVEHIDFETLHARCFASVGLHLYRKVQCLPDQGCAAHPAQRKCLAVERDKQQ